VTIDEQPTRAVAVAPEHDFTARVQVGSLASGAPHSYRARCGGGPYLEGRFRTAPAPADPAAVRFAWGGDLGGQNVCRDVARGYPIFATIAAREPHFVVGLGDMIYGDGTCFAIGALGNAQVPGPGPAVDVEGFRAHWQYNRTDPYLQRLLTTTGYYAVWDDHEVQNDFGPSEDIRPDVPGRHLLPPGRVAFGEWAPMDAVDARLYRARRWGAHLELFLLDTRSYRAASTLPDTASEPKTLLGRAQREWLEAGLAASTATWKLVVSSVPMSIPTGEALRDGWADAGGPTGYERELRGILRSAAGHGVRGLVWITTDVHFATAFHYRPFPEDEAFVVHEIATGPLHAGFFPRQDLDPTLRPQRLFFHGPMPTGLPRSLDEALPWFNFGMAEVDAAGGLVVEVVDATGRVRQQVTLSP